jgi:glycerol-3-phosphate dehydrogenase (NAD(P)+)
MKAGIIGAGSWGPALANLLAPAGVGVSLWDVDQDLLHYMARSRENKKYLPGHRLADGVEIADTQRSCVSGADFVVTAVPSQHFRSALTSALPEMSESAFIVNVAKGIEIGSLKTLSQICKEIAPERKYAVLSGPSHAEEVADALPTTVTVASSDARTASAVQDIFMNDRFRVYTQSDVIGVELGGALKNIIALGAGISDGMGYGDNTKAALMTRGITEMARLGKALGAKGETFFGLSGIGDLIVTCTSMHSRNRRCGIMIGEGTPPKDATARIGMVVEGVPSAEAARALAHKHGVEMPITEAICRIVKGETPPEIALAALMTRGKKEE